MVTELDIHGDPRQRKGFRGKERKEGKKLYMRELLKASQKLTAHCHNPGRCQSYPEAFSQTELRELRELVKRL